MAHAEHVGNLARGVAVGQRLHDEAVLVVFGCAFDAVQDGGGGVGVRGNVFRRGAGGVDLLPLVSVLVNDDAKRGRVAAFLAVNVPGCAHNGFPEDAAQFLAFLGGVQQRANSNICLMRDGAQVVLLGGENVNDYLRTPQVSDMASRTSVNGDVRRKLVELQQQLARRQNDVMDGRDIGTVVLPDAQVKIFLTASVEVRAGRRYKEMIEKGEEADLEAIKAQIKERDERDMNREISPLKQAEDAVLVDTSDMSIDEVVERILGIVEEKIG